MDLTLLSLSINVFKFKFSLSLSLSLSHLSLSLSLLSLSLLSLLTWPRAVVGHKIQELSNSISLEHTFLSTFYSRISISPDKQISLKVPLHHRFLLLQHSPAVTSGWSPGVSNCPLTNALHRVRELCVWPCSISLPHGGGGGHTPSLEEDETDDLEPILNLQITLKGGGGGGGTLSL